jgi:hypothetical protein
VNDDDGMMELELAREEMPRLFAIVSTAQVIVIPGREGIEFV